MVYILSNVKYNNMSQCFSQNQSRILMFTDSCQTACTSHTFNPKLDTFVEFECWDLQLSYSLGNSTYLLQG